MVLEKDGWEQMGMLWCQGAQKLSNHQWRIQDFCEGDAAGVWPPIFSEGMTPTFLRQILARIGVVVRGLRNPGFLDFEFPERGALGAKRRGADGVGSGEGRRSPSRYGVWGHIPQKMFEI